MADSIREQIIQAVITRLAIITTANGFNTGIGATVERAKKNLPPDDLPACVVWPKPETVARDYGRGLFSMPLQIEGLMLHGSTAPSTLVEQMLADMIEAIIGVGHSVAYTSGGTYEIAAGDTIEGAASGATALVQAVSVTSGAWEDGDAAGTLTLRRVYGTFEAENLDVGANTNVATIAGAPSATDPIAATTASLAESIEYAGGGADDYPEGNEQATGMITNWNIFYRTISGDPYHQ
jgi:hypothetical protein